MNMLETAVSAEPILQVRGLTKQFTGRGGLRIGQSPVIKAIDGISFDVFAGQTVGLVGESGCGKSTTVRTILRLEEPTAGQTLFRGEHLRHEPRGNEAAAAAHPGGVSGPLCVAQSAHDG